MGEVNTLVDQALQVARDAIYDAGEKISDIESRIPDEMAYRNKARENLVAAAALISKNFAIVLVMASTAFGQTFQQNVHENQYPGSVHKIFGWAGEPRHEQPSRDDNGDEVDDTTQTFWQGQPFTPPANVQSQDDLTINCQDGEVDIVIVQVMIDGKPDIVAKHAGGDGKIDWNGVAGENNNQHDHWPNAFGIISIVGFNRDEGDRIIVTGHTVTNGRGTGSFDDDQFGPLQNVPTRRIYSQQGGGGGAHDEDTLGYLQFPGLNGTEAPGARTIHSNVGICETIGEFNAFADGYQAVEDDYWATHEADEVEEVDEDWLRFMELVDRHDMHYLTDDQLNYYFNLFFGD